MPASHTHRATPARAAKTVYPRALAMSFCALAATYGIYRAIRLAWVCDDAFISFRYAYNLARGKGLVFNAGEYVEGFTNLLWTLLLAPAFWLVDAADIAIFSQALGIAFYAALLAVYAVRCARIFERAFGETGSVRRPAWHSWPWTLPALAAHHHLHVFATSGLETALFTFLITAGLLLLADERPGRTAQHGAFGLLALACLTRPDGLLIYGVAALWNALAALFDAKASRTSPARWLLAQTGLHVFFLAVVGGSFLFRVTYYGDFLPNTFYAKSAHDPYMAQGAYYTGLYFASYWILIPALFALVWNARHPAGSLIFAVCLSWLVYVVWVGGDFMFGRFLTPITPLLLFGGEFALRRFARRRGAARSAYRVWWPAALLTLTGALLRYDPYQGLRLPVLGYVGEEYKIYTRDAVSQLRATALATGPTMRAADPVVAFVGAQAALIFYWDITTAIEAQTGLTDRTIARQPLDRRGWIGHEKNASLEYLRERGAAFILRPPPAERRRSDGVIRIRGLLGEFELIEYQPEVMGILRKDAAFEIPPRSEMGK